MTFKNLIVSIPEDEYEKIMSNDEFHTNRDNIVHYVKNGLLLETAMPTINIKVFEKIIVRYPPDDVCSYPKYRGKPYYSIQYLENGEHIVGFGTYDVNILSDFIKTYFIGG